MPGKRKVRIPNAKIEIDNISVASHEDRVSVKDILSACSFVIRKLISDINERENNNTDEEFNELASRLVHNIDIFRSLIIRERIKKRDIINYWTKVYLENRGTDTNGLWRRLSAFAALIEQRSGISSLHYFDGFDDLANLFNKRGNRLVGISENDFELLIGKKPSSAQKKLVAKIEAFHNINSIITPTVYSPEQMLSPDVDRALIADVKALKKKNKMKKPRLLPDWMKCETIGELSERALQRREDSISDQATHCE